MTSVHVLSSAAYDAGRNPLALDLEHLRTAAAPPFETMTLARVPVIVSDEWVPPDGPERRRRCGESESDRSS
jgi:hypothetical protein